MNVLRLALAYLAARPLLTALHVTLLALGTATLVVLILFTEQAERKLQGDARPVDLVVGAKGSPLQLILSTVLHVDIPTGNVPFAAAKSIAADPMVRSATPLSLGDTYRGARIVGTDASFFELYGLALAQGKPFDAEMEAVIGAHVAAHAGLHLGAQFAGSHGLAAAGTAHGDHPYRVVGILAPTGTVVDRLILTPLESVWEVHGSHGAIAPDAREVTAVLVRYRSPLAAAMLPRRINATTAMQAASPAYEGARLMSLVGVGVEALRVFGGVLMACAALSIFIALTTALQERARDLALLRTLGAPPAKLLALIAAEGMTLVGAGAILGLALGHAAAEAIGRWLAHSQSWSVTGFAWEPAEAILLVLIMVVGAATCAIPALQAYVRDPATVLLEQ
jgi:putative ABC transport system permease protein